MKPFSSYSPQRPRSLFLYGTLRALPLLAWASTGDSTKVDVVKPLVCPARVRGYARLRLHGKDYPAVVKHADASAVDGLLFRPQNQSQRQKLDDFEGETYLATQVDVQTVDGAEVADADIYLWNGDLDAISTEDWDLEIFIRERLDDWLELFGDMELVGDDEAYN
ncbi:hypothetical protein AX14_012444 [Amanita brunnescens Koide BX004]|nr:hypothetical protein AX14_012444 [Amanita brunnescens Koide BX004]